MRDKKRKLTKKLKSKVYSPEAKAEQSKVEQQSKEQIEAIAEMFLAEKETAKKPQLTIVKSNNSSKSKTKKK